MSGHTAYETSKIVTAAAHLYVQGVAVKSLPNHITNLCLADMNTFLDLGQVAIGRVVLEKKLKRLCSTLSLACQAQVTNKKKYEGLRGSLLKYLSQGHKSNSIGKYGEATSLRDALFVVDYYQGLPRIISNIGDLMEVVAVHGKPATLVPPMYNAIHHSVVA